MGFITGVYLFSSVFGPVWTFPLAILFITPGLSYLAQHKVFNLVITQWVYF